MLQSDRLLESDALVASSSVQRRKTEMRGEWGRDVGSVMLTWRLAGEDVSLPTHKSLRSSESSGGVIPTPEWSGMREWI